MKENDWTEKICQKLKPFLKKHSFEATTLQKIPYAQEINCYKEDWNLDPEDMTTAAFETDLAIYERNDEKIIPRVIIEAKIGNVTTHDAITYSYKAEKHKTIVATEYGQWFDKNWEESYAYLSQNSDAQLQELLDQLNNASYTDASATDSEAE